MDTEFEDLVKRIITLRSYEFALDDIHALVINSGVSEETFYLAYKASTIMMEPVVLTNQGPAN